jgi:hypothetical protein
MNIRKQKGASAIFVLSALLVGTVLGVTSVGMAIKNIVEGSSIKNGAWHHNPYVGSEEASGYTRAAVALIGFLGMKREESIYFVARADDEGQGLVGNCSYRVEGAFNGEQARWWSITAYNAITSKLIPNDQKRYSFNGDNLALNEDGGFTLLLSAEEQEGNWIPIGQADVFDLTLRLYNTPESVRDNVEALALPTVTKEGCS